MTGSWETPREVAGVGTGPRGHSDTERSLKCSDQGLVSLSFCHCAPSHHNSTTVINVTVTHSSLVAMLNKAKLLSLWLTERGSPKETEQAAVELTRQHARTHTLACTHSCRFYWQTDGVAIPFVLLTVCA